VIQLAAALRAVWYSRYQWKLYVTFAEQDKEKHDDKARARNTTASSTYSSWTAATVIAWFSRHGLNSPWGLALAPANFGKF